MPKHCVVCQTTMKGRRDKSTCSPRCRTALYRMRGRLATHTIAALPPQANQMLEEIKGVSVRAYRRILTIVEREGAGLAEQAIYAAYETADDCLVQQAS